MLTTLFALVPQAPNSADHMLENSFDNVPSEDRDAPHIEAYDSCSVNCVVGDPESDALCKVSVDTT